MSGKKPSDRGTEGPSGAAANGLRPINTAIGLAATCLVLIIVLVRALVPFMAKLWWDTDPAYAVMDSGKPLPVTEFGPAGAAVADWLAVAALGLAIAFAIPRHRLAWGMLALWLIGFGFALWHGMHDAGSLRLGSQWIGTTAIGLAAMHLGTDGRLRRLMLAATIALIVPLALYAAYQITIEHAQTLEEYRRTKQQFIEARGWADGSAEVRQYERRLEQREATGRFSLANVFGSVMVGLTLVAAGAAAQCGVRNAECGMKRWMGIGLILLAGLGVVTIALTGSKGAMLALLIGGGAGLAAVALTRRGRKRLGRWAAAAVLIGIIAVIVRGMIGPPAPGEEGGERSLLFRYYYWQAAGRMVVERPFAGVGPGRFQEQYVRHKNPLQPEEINDPHNVLAAYVSTLGVGGWAWSAMLMTMLWRAGRMDDVADLSGCPLPAPRVFEKRLRWAAAITVGVAAFGAQYWVLLPTWWIDGAVLWLLSAALFVTIMGWGSGLVGWRGRWGRAGLFAAATAVMVHNQIEMAFTHAMAGMVLAMVVGAAAGAGVAATPPRRVARAPIAAGFAVAVGLSVIAQAWLATLPIVSEQSALKRAADARRAGDTEQAVRWLAAAAAATPVPDPLWVTHQARLTFELAAHEHHARRYPARDRHLNEAMRLLSEARAYGVELSHLWRAEASLCREAARMTEDSRWLGRAAEAIAQAAAHAPRSVSVQFEAGETMFDAGRTADAAGYYRRAIELSDKAYLDPLRQLTEEQRRRAEERSK